MLYIDFARFTEIELRFYETDVMAGRIWIMDLQMTDSFK